MRPLVRLALLTERCPEPAIGRDCTNCKRCPRHEASKEEVRRGPQA